MKITVKDYKKSVEKASPNTRHGYTIFGAFLVGGIICTLGQLLFELYNKTSMGQDMAKTLTSVTLIALSALFTGLNVYDKIAKFGGAGSLVPITGFANAVASPALEFKTEGYVLGLGAKLFIISGPVIVYGIAASAVYGVILFLIR